MSDHAMLMVDLIRKLLAVEPDDMHIVIERPAVRDFLAEAKHHDGMARYAPGETETITIAIYHRMEQ